jgi:hypothetical protein
LRVTGSTQAKHQPATTDREPIFRLKVPFTTLQERGRNNKPQVAAISRTESGASSLGANSTMQYGTKCKAISLQNSLFDHAADFVVEAAPQANKICTASCPTHRRN